MSDLLIVLDTETTGIPKGLDSPVRAVSLGAAAYLSDTFEEVDRFYITVCPSHFAPGYENAERVHGLKRRHLEQEGYGFREGWTAWMTWVEAQVTEQQGKLPYFLAWNSAFDALIMALWYSDVSGQPAKHPLWPCWQHGSLEAPAGCLQAMYREWTKTQPGIHTPRYGSLKSAAETLGAGTQATTHNALADARLAAAVMRKLVRYEEGIARAQKKGI